MINQFPDYISINLSILVKPYYLGNTEFFLHALHHTGKSLGDRDVHLYALRNTPVNVYPYRSIVDTIVDIMQLPPERIYIHVRDTDFQHHGVTVIPYNNWDESWRIRDLNTYLLDLSPSSLDLDVPRFGCLFGRMQLGRALLAYHLESQHPKQSFVVFQAHRDQLDHQIFGIEQHFREMHHWWRHRDNPPISQRSAHDTGQFDWPENIITYPTMSRHFQIEIVAETDYYRCGDYTEKTWRCLATGKPFVLLCGAGSLSRLRDLGFRTFAPVIDESYDEIDNFHDRVSMICGEIDRLAGISDSDWRSMVKDLYDIAAENRDFYQTWYPDISTP